MKRFSRSEKILISFLLLGICASWAHFFLLSSTVETVQISESSLDNVKPLGVDIRPKARTEPSGVPRTLVSSEIIGKAPAPLSDPQPIPSELISKPLENLEVHVESELLAPASLEQREEPPIPKIAPVNSMSQVPAPDNDTTLIDYKPSAIPNSNLIPNTETKEHPEFWLWFGEGMNFQYYKQSIPGIGGEAIFQNIQGPTLLVQAGAQGETLGLDLSYKETPGKMSSSNTITVTNGSYNWRTISTEGLYRKDENWNFRTGFQHHLMPFMSLDATTAVLDVKTNMLTMLTLGFDRNFKFSSKLRGEWQMRYQHPFLSGSTDGSSFSVTPKFAFDGAVGSIYSLSNSARLGLYWYGQWHEYSFNYGRGVTEFSGSQTLFYSNIEIRLGLEF